MVTIEDIDVCSTEIPECDSASSSSQGVTDLIDNTSKTTELSITIEDQPASEELLDDELTTPTSNQSSLSPPSTHGENVAEPDQAAAVKPFKTKKQPKKRFSRKLEIKTDKKPDTSDSDLRSEDDEGRLCVAMKGAWAEPLMTLWQDGPLNFPSEKRYNTLVALSHPHCAVCALLSPTTVTSAGMARKSSLVVVSPGSGGVPAESPPLMPEICFAASAATPNPMGSNSTVGEDGTSALLVCGDCRVCVHTSCYGVVEKPAGVWKCDRCRGQNRNACCELCCVRGGALKTTSAGRWAHITCALTISEVMFDDIQQRNSINLDRLPAARYRLKCVYCNSIEHSPDHPGVCAQCSLGRCTTPFHVTCAHAAGVEVTTTDWPFPIHLTCNKHAHTKPKPPTSRSLCDLEMRSWVYAKFRNTRYYQAQVVERAEQVLYKVDFDDGSFSDDLHPEDIEGMDCVSMGPPPEMCPVTIRWTDGGLYGGVFRGTNSQVMYTVEFEDGSQKKYERGELWRTDEDLPKHIKAKVSKATERKYDIFYKDVVDSRRPRVRKLPYSLEEYDC